MKSKDTLKPKEAKLLVELKEQLAKFEVKKEKSLDSNRLRHTVIRGIPCDFIVFVPRPSKTENKKGDTPGFDAVGPDESYKAENIRKKVWYITCRMEETQNRCIQNFNDKVQKERAQIAEQIAEIRRKYGDNPKHSKQITDSKLFYYMDLVEKLKKVPNDIHSPEELYEYYLGKGIEGIGKADNFAADLARSDPKCEHWKLPMENRQNSLCNVLTAIYHYDPEIGYGQGMGCVMSWILKLTQDPTGEIDKNTKRHILKYDESFSFYVWIHIAENLKFRDVYDR